MKPSEFPSQLILQRGKHGFTQKSLADKLNVSARSVMTWESGKSMPHKAMRIQLAHVFDLDPTYFLDDGDLPGSRTPSRQADELQNLYNQLENIIVQADASDEVKVLMSQALQETTEKIMRANR